MKNALIFLMFLFAANASVSAQGYRVPYPIKLGVGNSAYVLINGQDYIRGNIGFTYNYTDSAYTGSGTYDSTVSMFWMANQTPILYHVVDTMFQYGSDSSNRQVRNIIGLRTWLIANGY